MIKIGSSVIDTDIFLAPLSGCSDLAFRLISREHGAKFCFFEMIDSNCIIRGSKKKTLSILDTVASDRPIAAQLLGEEPDMMLRAAKEITRLRKMPFLDINAACPAKKVIKKGAGSYLLKNKETLYKILEKLVLNIDIPITLKIRIGFDERNIKDIVATAKKCESIGVSAIFVHGRTRQQGYSGEIDYDSIKAIKESLKIPVIGNGNIFSPQDARNMIHKTGCDAVLVARGALGNPWIFKDIEEYIRNGALPPERNLTVKRAALKQHLHYIEKHRTSSPSGKIGFMRKTAFWYIRDLPGSAGMRRQISVVNSYEKMIKLIDSLNE